VEMQKRLQKMERKLEDEMRELHAVISEQQKQLDQVLAENRSLKQPDEPAKEAEPVPAEPIKVEGDVQPLPPSVERTAPLRPWPLRSVRKDMGALRPSASPRTPMKLRLTVQLGGGAKAADHNLEKVDVEVMSSASVADVKKLLAEAGVGWAGNERGPDSSLAEGNLLVRGALLKPELTLQEQGVVDGSQLRLLKSRISGQLRCQSLHAPAGPRGILMNAEGWEPKGTRKAVSDFFDTVDGDDLRRLSKIRYAKQGIVVQEYKTDLVP